MMLFLSMVAWYFGAGVLAASAASGIGLRFRLVESRALLEACFRLFLLVLGFVVLQRMARHSGPLQELTALPRRETALREWLTGAALGWAIVIGALLPALLLLRLHAELSFSLPELRAALLAVATTAIAALAHEMTFRGYPFGCLTRAVGPSFAVLLMMIGAGLAAWQHAWMPAWGVLASMLLTVLLSISWLRTHAIWLAWGLDLSLVACASVLFGLRLDDERVVSTLVRGRLFGPDWLTGGRAGPVASFGAVVLLALGIAVLYRLTREYAWNYTHRPITGAGEPVVIAPPPAHAAMEEQPARAPALVQILATTPTTFSVPIAGGEIQASPVRRSID